MDFMEWLEQQGCCVVVDQEDDGSNYVCLTVTLPSGASFGITVDV